MPHLEICPPTLLEVALSNYDAPNRFYHTREHGQQVAKSAHRQLMLLDIQYHKELEHGARILEVAGLLHDCWQGPQHELASAVVALSACPYRQFRNQIAWLIVAGTAHDYGTAASRSMAADAFLIGAGELPVSPSQRPMLLFMAEALHDADVSGFGTPNKGAYLHRANALFKEYCFKGLPITEYSKRRRDFLQRMQDLVRQGFFLEQREKTLCALIDQHFNDNVDAEIKWLNKLRAAHT